MTRSKKIIRAGDVRQGEIILKKTWQRVVFFGALAAGVLLVAIAAIA